MASTTSTYTAKALATTGAQLRLRGTTPTAYKVPLVALRAWAGAHPHHAALVQALTHHGWANGGSVACRAANPNLHEKLVAAVAAKHIPATVYTVGTLTGPQVVAAMAALAKANAPAPALAALWACYAK